MIKNADFLGDLNNSRFPSIHVENLFTIIPLNEV